MKVASPVFVCNSCAIPVKTMDTMIRCGQIRPCLWNKGYVIFQVAFPVLGATRVQRPWYQLETMDRVDKITPILC